ncbi:MAG: LPS biosynthesis choline kinase [Alphaproteobacteria bacterium]|nr:MAG: LPS biosynthesis choline kinase [Alphaproteobacteria bacterium]
MALEAEVREALARIPALRDAAPAAVSCARLGGLTNRVYRIEADGARYVLRIPGEGTGDYIDRAVEAHNAQVAAAAGVSAEVLFVDETDGLMLTRHLDDVVTMTPELFKSRPGAPARAAAVLKRMHTCGRTFRFRFELFAMIDDYLAVLARRKAALPEGYHEVVEAAGAVREALAAHPGELAPCHCDPLCENFLDDGTRMWLVDWEYSGMNDPIWDLGDLSVEAGFDAAQDMAMMEAYCGGAPGEDIYGRMVIYKAMCDLLWTLWGLIQHADGNPAEDFWAYALNRFSRCKALMATADFEAHVAAVRRGR